MARGELRRRVERRVRVLDAVVGLVAAAQAGEDPHGLLGRRLVDDDLLEAAGERAVLLDLLELLEGGRPDDAEVAAGQQRLHHRRQVHRAAGHRAGADGGVNLVDEQDRPRPRGQRLDDRLEALLEVAAEPGAGEQRAGVEREDLDVLERVRHLVAEQLRRQAFGHRRLADARIADEHRVVLAPPRQHFDRALQFCGAADERIEHARPAPARSGCRSRSSSGSRAVAGSSSPPPAPALSPGAPGATSGVLAMPCEMNSSTSSRVTPCCASRIARVGLRLLQDRREHVADMRFVALRALHVHDGGLEHPAERGSLLRLPVAPARQMLDRFVEVVVQLPPQRGGIGAAGREDPFAVGVVQQRVEQVFERQVRVAPRHGFAVGDVQNGLDRR